MRGGGSGANLAGIVYEPELTLGLPRAVTVGTSLNALAHAAEALYVEGRNPEGDREALAGATLISRVAPARRRASGRPRGAAQLLEGAMHAGAALASAGLGLGHALAQAIGGRYGLPHGAMNALSLPQALRFNEPVAGEEIARFGEAMGTDDPIGRVEELARLGDFEPPARLRRAGGRAGGALRRQAGVRPGARANPRPATLPHSSNFYALCGSAPTGAFPPAVHGSHRAITSFDERASGRSDGLTPAGGCSFPRAARMLSRRPEETLKASGVRITRKEATAMEFRILGPLEVDAGRPGGRRQRPQAACPARCSSSCTGTSPSRPSS